MKNLIPTEDKKAFEDARLETNITRMFGLSAYIVILQLALLLYNIVFNFDFYIETRIHIAPQVYWMLSIVTLVLGAVFWVLLELARKGKINSRTAKVWLVYSLLLLYYVIEMVFCTFNILTHQEINGHLILVLLVGVVPVLAFWQSLVLIGSSAVYTIALMLCTQGNTDPDGLSLWSKFFYSDTSMYFFITMGLAVVASVCIYRLYASNFLLVNQLTNLSETDSLTRIFNRRRFDEIIDHEWRRAVRQGAGLTLIFFDVDHFKMYNDTYGHPKGDACLAKIGDMLYNNFQRANEYAARYGGEEFAIIMTDTTQEQGIHACERLIRLVEELRIPFALSDVSDIVTISAGINYIIPTEKDSLEAFITETDATMYKAKREGRNRYAAGSARTPYDSSADA